MRRQGTLHSIAAITAIAGAVADVALTLYTGRRNSSVILMTLFAVWVASPFAALLWATRIARGWSRLTIATGSWLLPTMALVTPVIYSVIAFGPPVRQTAFTFLVVPAASWLIGAIVLGVSEAVSRRGD